MGIDVIIPLGPQDSPPHRLLDLLSEFKPTISATRPKPPDLPGHFNWVMAPTGRAQQLNRAIEGTQNDWLWLVHADSSLDPQALGCVEAFCQHAPWSDIAYGKLRYSQDGPFGVRLNQWGANLRSHLWHLPYGDQALCIHRRLWQALGGFQTGLTRGEDLDFVIRSRAVGARVRRLPYTITTSARRYQSRGWLKTTVEHQLSALKLIRQAKRWRP